MLVKAMSLKLFTTVHTHFEDSAHRAFHTNLEMVAQSCHRMDTKENYR